MHVIWVYWKLQKCLSADSITMPSLTFSVFVKESVSVSSFSRRLPLQLRPTCWGSRRSWRGRLRSWTAGSRSYRAEEQEVITYKSYPLLDEAKVAKAALFSDRLRQGNSVRCLHYVSERNVKVLVYTFADRLWKKIILYLNKQVCRGSCSLLGNYFYEVILKKSMKFVLNFYLHNKTTVC